MIRRFDEFQRTLLPRFEDLVDYETKEYTSFSLDEALEDASFDLGIPANTLKYEIVQKGSHGILGFFAKEWVLMVFRERSVLQKIQSVGAEEESEEGEGAKKDPRLSLPNFRIFVHSDGVVTLRVFRVEENEENEIIDKIMTELVERGVDTPEKKIVMKSVFDLISDEVQVSKIPASFDGRAKISELKLSDNEVEAFIIVEKPKKRGVDLKREDIRSFLIENGVMEGILEGELERFEYSPAFGEPFLVATGIEPIHENGGEIKYFFERDGGGPDDLKSVDLIKTVKADELIAQLTNIKTGVNGRSVKGDDIYFKQAEKKFIQAGQNTILSPNLDMLSAAVDGRVVVDPSGVISVEDVVYINGDVGSKTGHIIVDPSVVIKGNVSNGFIVISKKGDVVVKGNVGRALIEAGNDVIIGGGISSGLSYITTLKRIQKDGDSYEELLEFLKRGLLSQTMFDVVTSEMKKRKLPGFAAGEEEEEEEEESEDPEDQEIQNDGVKMEPRVIAKRHLFAQYINNSKIDAGGCVVTERGVVNSQVFVDDSFICTGKKSAVIGGEILVGKTCWCREMGNEVELKTSFILGNKPRLYDDRRILKRLNQQVQKHQAEIEKDVKYLNRDIHDKRGDVTKAKMEQLEDLTKELELFKKGNEEMLDKIKEIKKGLRVLSDEKPVGFASLVFVNTFISIHQTELYIKREYAGDMVRFGEREDSIFVELESVIPTELEEKKAELLSLILP